MPKRRFSKRIKLAQKAVTLLFGGSVLALLLFWTYAPTVPYTPDNPPDGYVKIIVGRRAEYQHPVFVKQWIGNVYDCIDGGIITFGILFMILEIVRRVSERKRPQP